MAPCGFNTDIEYYDEKTGKYISYECREPEENVLDNGLCIFHDGNYLKDSKNKEANEENIRKKLSEKLAESGPLICIGYHLSSIPFKETHVDRSINFSGAQFNEEADFSKSLH